VTRQVPDAPTAGPGRRGRSRGDALRVLRAAGARQAPAGESPHALHAPRIAQWARWLILAALVHALGLGLWLYLAPAPREADEIIRVTLFPTTDAPPEEDLPREILHFRKPSHPRVRESEPVAREVLALAPPPLEVSPDERGASGGYSVTPASEAVRGTSAWGGAGGGVAFTGVGAGNARAPTGTFEEYVGGMRQIGLDVVFVIDATGSMGWLIDEVKQRVHFLAQWIRELVPVTRFGVVAYRDEDDPEFLVRVQPLTLNASKVYRFLDDLEARGGGDVPEGLHAGLAAAVEQAGWKRDARRVIVALGDAPPRPERFEETLALARRFREQGGTLTIVDVSFDANPEIVARRLHKSVEELRTIDPRGVLPEFLTLAEAGGGDAATLQGETRVARRLAVLIFGQRWAKAVEPLLGDL